MVKIPKFKTLDAIDPKEKSMDRLYSKEQVKRAFWLTFESVGELYFPPFARYPEESEESLRLCWTDFLKNLEVYSGSTPKDPS